MTTNQAEEKLIKARIKLQARNPFFSYLSLFLKFVNDKNNRLPEYAGMGVSPDGTLTYKDDFVNELNDEECIGVLTHEICHLAFLHLVRRGSRDGEKWNIAVDLAVNSILKENGFELPKNGIIPQNNMFDFPIGLFKKAFRIENVNQKTAEEIYEELPELNYQNGNGQGKQGNGQGNMKVKCNGFDKHEEENQDKDGKSKGKPSQAEKQELENEWLNRLEEAYVSAKQRGKLPMGMERYIDEIKKSQINWKVLLQRLIQSTIPIDFTYMRRGKKSIATKTYLPSVIKEKIDVCIGIDLSGSIGKEELTEFMSEVIGISKAYQNSITMRLLTHDIEVHNDYEITNGNIQKIKELKLKGGGGTSHEPIFKYINEKVRDCKAVVFFTDGYSDLENIDFNKHKWKKIFIINKQGNDDYLKGRSDCVCIKMKEDRNGN